MTDHVDHDAIVAGLDCAMTQPCLMCGAQPDGAVLFEPDDPESWGARPGKRRLAFYSLCDACVRNTSAAQRERELARRIVGPDLGPVRHG